MPACTTALKVDTDRPQRQVEVAVLHCQVDQELLEPLQILERLPREANREAHRFAPAGFLLVLLRRVCILDCKRPRMASRASSAA